jgi:hypothetical protein
MSFWANVFQGKRPSGQMSFWANVTWQMYGQMSCHRSHVRYVYVILVCLHKIGKALKGQLGMKGPSLPLYVLLKVAILNCSKKAFKLRIGQ